MPDDRVPGRFAFLLTAAEQVTRQRLGDALAGTGVGVEAWRVLSTLAAYDGIGMSELATRTLLNAPTLSKLVDRLVSEGMVYRRQGEQDRRRVAVHLSVRGRRLVERSRDRVRELDESLERALGADAARDLDLALRALCAPGGRVGGQVPQ